MITNQQFNKEEDEIDLKELFLTIWKHKIKIILFSFIITLFSIFYAMSKPNNYTSSTTLIPQGETKQSLGGLGALAGIAGIDISGGSQINIGTSLQTILNDFTFQEKIITKYNLINKLKIDINNLVFPFNNDTFYNLLNKKDSSNNVIDIDINELKYNAFIKIKSIIKITTDKKSGIIQISSEHPDRFLAKELVKIYLIELTSQLRTIEMSNVNKKLEYYNNELARIQDINIKEQLSKIISGLVQKRVLSMANTYYNVTQFTLPQVAYIKDKTGPKRALIVIVSFITSLILGIFFVFLLEFIKRQKTKKI